MKLLFLIFFQRKTGRPTSDIWNHYKTEKSNGKNYVICIYCTTQKYGYPNATKMKIHTVKCMNCPADVREQYKKELTQMVNKSEASKSVVLVKAGESSFWIPLNLSRYEKKMFVQSTFIVYFINIFIHFIWLCSYLSLISAYVSIRVQNICFYIYIYNFSHNISWHLHFF